MIEMEKIKAGYVPHLCQDGQIVLVEPGGVCSLCKIEGEELEFAIAAFTQQLLDALGFASIRTIAQKTGVPPSTLTTAIYEGRTPYVDLGKRHKLLRAQVVEAGVGLYGKMGRPY
jgi:hypothetical protein